MFLVKNGVPYDVAMTMTPVRRLACVVALGELAGGVFDWTAFRWQERR